MDMLSVPPVLDVLLKTAILCAPEAWRAGSKAGLYLRLITLRKCVGHV